MLDVEVFGADLAPDCPPEPDVARICSLAAERLGIETGHVAVEFVDRARIAELNGRHRSKAEPTDVLSFPIDGAGPLPEGAPRELGDVVICPAETRDLREAIVHGVLHLLGMDHESDDGEMLALQRDVLDRLEP
jgi:probable rRNA maturation factor